MQQLLQESIFTRLVRFRFIVTEVQGQSNRVARRDEPSHMASIAMVVCILIFVVFKYTILYDIASKLQASHILAFL